MKKKITFFDLLLKERLLCLVFLLLLCNKNYSQTFCRPASHSTGIDGLCLGATGVTSPELAYDSSLSTFSTIYNALGVGCLAQETLTFGQTAKAGDQVIVYFGSGNGLLSAGLLSNSTIQTRLTSSGPDFSDPVPLNSGLLNLTLLDNVNKVYVVKYTLPADADQIKIQTGGLVSLLITLKLYDVRLQFAKPTITGGETQSVCAGQSITLSATAAAGTTLAWYDSPVSTNALSNVGTFTTPPLNASTTYYVSTSRTAGCESSERLPVTINVINPVQATINSTGTSICSAGATQATTLSVVNPILGTTYSWYNAPTAGTLLNTGTTYTPTVPTGSTTFYVEASIGTCKAARTAVTVTSSPVPGPATVLTQSVTILSGQNATLSASTAEAGVVLDWYDVATGGTKLLGDSNTFTTPVLTANKTYYIESRNSAGGCVNSPRVAVTVNVLANPLGTCLEANSQQTTQDGLCILCSSTNQNDSVDGNSATFATLTLPAALAGGWIQQTLQFNNSGKAGDIVDVELALPTGITDISLLGAVSLATYNGTTYNNDRVSINNALVTLNLLSGNRFKASITAGSNFDRVEIRIGGTVSLLTNLDIYQATYRFKAPTITGNATPICSGSTATLTASTAVGETVIWYDAPTDGTVLSSTATYTTPGLNTNTTYYVGVTRNGCVNSERNPVIVNVINPIAPAVVASPANLCSGSTTTLDVQNPVTGTTYKWYDEPAGGNLLYTGNSYTTPVLTVSRTYHVEAVIGSCLSATRTAVPVSVNPRPAAPIVTSSVVNIQSGQTVVLTVSSPEPNVTFDWYDSNGVLIVANASSYSRPAAATNTIYYIEARNTVTNCTSSTRAVINVVVNSSGSNCLLGVSQETTLDGTPLLCPNIALPLLCAVVTTPDDSVDGNSGTAARLSLPVGVGGYLQQMITFATPGKAGDIIDVELGVPIGLADISLLSSINLQSFNSGTANPDGFDISSVANVQVLGGNRFKVSFVAGGPFTSVQVRLNVGVAALFTNLDIYEASYRYPVTITGASAPICAGQTTTLNAIATGGQTVNWFTTPTGGTPLSATYTTSPLPVTTPFYLEEVRDGCSTRREVIVTVLPVADVTDISIANTLTASCSGTIVLAPTSPLAGATFKYYTDGAKTQSVVGTIDSSTGAITINGLTAAGAPYVYYISVSNNDTCENTNGTLKQVVVNYPSVSSLTVTPALTGCSKVNLKDAITNLDTTGNTTYTFFGTDGTTVITEQAAANSTVNGTYFIQAQTAGTVCPSAKMPVAVSVSPAPTLTLTTNSTAVTKGSSVPLVASSSNGTVVWYDQQGNVVPGNTGPLNTAGVFSYTAVATLGTCTTSQTITVSVIDPATCDSLLKREYAKSQLSGTIVTGTVTNDLLGADGDPSTYSTITTGLGLLGIGTTWQNLQWPETIPKGTPVTVKLGLENSLLAVGQNVTVIGTKRDSSNNPIDIGTLQSVSGSLLNLLPGQNSFEFTFVPSDNAGLQDYNGIRVQLGSVLSVAQNVNVYDAYYKKQVTQIDCGQGDIEDIFSGVRDLGVGALTSTVGVSNPWNVADDDVSTYATMFTGVGVLAAAELTTSFRTPSMVGDSLRITISKPGTLLNVGLLTGFTIQLYSGNIAVGGPIQSDSNLLTLKLLSGDTMAMTIIAPQTQPYDKVVIQFGGAATVIDQLRVHTIDRVTNTKVIGGDLNNSVTVCPATDITLQVPPKSCSDYAWYDSPKGGNLLTSGQTYTLPATLAPGTYKYYIQPIRYGCAALERGEVTVVVRPTTPANAIANVTINAGNNSIICSENGTVTLDAVLNATPVLTNPVYHWYSFDGTGQTALAETTSKLVLTNLLPGTYTYYVGVSSTEFCETAPADRKQVTFTILPSSLVTDITVGNASICHDTVATLTPTSSLANPVFFWYLDANKTQPIVNGVIGSVTYAINPTTGVLTASGLTTAMSPISYYVAVKSDNTCQNKNGELAVATIVINDPATPTSTNYNQNFCLVNNPTVANLQVNEANVVWYTAATGGTALDPTTALVSGIYHGAIKDLNGCESSVRSVVTVTVGDPLTPTTTDTTQDFCLVNNPTVANLQTNETNVVWYSSASGGAALVATTALANGPYYAALKDAVTGCESSVRLLVTVTITDPLTPTTTDTTQDFCLVNNPTVANLQTNETNVVWYSSASGGAALVATTALANGPYYAALKDAVTGCESSIRLLVTVTITDPGTPTLVTAGTQNFCLVNAPTFASVQFNQANIVWYDALNGGNLIPSATALTSGTYFASIKDPVSGCESAARLSVVINVTDPGTPTLVTAGTQNFCLVNAPTFASVQFNQANIVWYDALNGGNLIPSTTALTSGTYFASIKDPVSGCESAARLSVVINVTDPGTPTLVTAGTQNFCLVNAPTFASVQFNQANIVWYDALNGGNLIPSTTALTSGTYFASIKDPVSGCESAARLSVTINVTDPGTPTLVTAGTQNFCLVNAPTFASVQFNQANIVWYDALNGGNLIPSTTALTSGTYFASIKDPVSGCESAARLSVTINVTDPGTPTLVTAGTQNFCLVNAPTFASVQFNQANIVWYDALNGGNLIPSATALTSGTYFASIKDPVSGCESITRLSVTINVTDPGTPTLVTAGTQNFCLVNAPTFASVQFNQANIVWYDALNGGNLIPSTTALTSGTYFASIKDPVSGCESATRLSVTINVTDPGTPTLVTAGTQNFCLVNAPTFASVQFNQANIIWYTALTGGTVIPSTTALTSGTYFASIKDPVSGCESAARLSVVINVTDPGTPTLVTAGTQNFCLVNAPTFASVQFNQANIVWYTALTGGTVIPSATALTSGTYFASIKDPVSGCESITRLSVTINVTDPGTPTLVTAGTQNFCLVNAPTFASVQFNQANIVWYDALNGGNLIPSTTALTSGTYFASIKDPVSGCESAARLSVVINVTDPGTPTLVNAGTQNFCLVNAPTFASVQFNQANIVWYTALTGGTVIPSATALTSGTYFASIKDPVSGCESAARLSVAINVTDPGTPTLVTAGTQNFCLVNAPTFASVQFNQANIVWYTALTGGTVIPSATALTSGTYFASIKDPVSGCESAARLQVTISVTDPATPTTTALAQVFCSGNNPTVANIQVNENNVVWYSSATGGTAIAPTTPLVNGDYYAALRNITTGCESSIRLKVTITVGNSNTPTTNNAAQTFCINTAPTFASIQVNQPNVVWYAASTGGTVIASTTPLTSGSYYGELTEAATGCKSATRLQVTVTIVNPAATPTTNAVTQNFCTLNTPTVANIQVNEANVIWYSTATGGTAIPSTTALTTGTYYGVVSSAISCENPVRLAVTVNVNSPAVITTPRTTQTFCPSKLPTLANILVNETNVVWYASATGGTPLAANTQLTAGTYYAGALNNNTNGCVSATRLGVSINFENDALVQLATTDDTPCVFQGVTYSIANGKSNYVWSVTNGTITSGGGKADGSATISWSDIGPGKVTVTYTNNCDETTTKTLNVTVATCSDLTITNTVSNPTPNFGEQITFTVTVNNVGQGNFINTIVSDLLPSGYDLVSSSTSSGVYDQTMWTIPTLNAGQSATLTIVAEVLSGGDYLSVASVVVSTPLDVDAANNSASVSVDPICLTVYNEFTPNNDGTNDFFRIDCIESHPNNELKVYNRYGALVYSKQHYENDWNGTANVSGVINRGDMLPTGTYFYVIDIGDGTVKKGWLSIMR